jgi:hypothetical protein
MLIEPLGDFFVCPMFAAQGEDRFAVRLQFAARPALALGFGLWLQIHIYFCTDNSVRRSREFRANARHSPRSFSCAKGRCLTELLVFKMVFIAVCIVDMKIRLMKQFAYRVVGGLVMDCEG